MKECGNWKEPKIMVAEHLALILLPTLKCNADCDYCFETRTSDTMTLQQFTLLMDKLLDYMEEGGFEETTIYWQGGEVFTMDPEWFLRARDIIENRAGQRGKRIVNRIQSNLLEYGEDWNTVIREMFSNHIGSSLDYPNIYRRVVGQGPETYNRLWIDRFREARSNQIDVGIIAIPNQETLKIGGAEFYSYFFDELGLESIQVNTPFPGGRANPTKHLFPLDNEKVSHFFLELIDIWLERGYADGIRIDPFNAMLNYFGDGCIDHLSCPWRPNCTGLFFCIDPKGHVSQCDCWVASYPEFRFGNIFAGESLGEILNSKARQRIKERPTRIAENWDCVECEYLAICHGGCAMRAYSTYKDIYAKDPYCETYKVMFQHLEKSAVKIAQQRTNQH
jgi:uncharacterized protein